MGRHWPAGRGVFHNDNSDLFIWVGEEDHLRIVSMQGSRDGPTVEGKNIKEVVARFIRACDAVQKVLTASEPRVPRVAAGVLLLHKDMTRRGEWYR